MVYRKHITNTIHGAQFKHGPIRVRIDFIRLRRIYQEKKENETVDLDRGRGPTTVRHNCVSLPVVGTR